MVLRNLFKQASAEEHPATVMMIAHRLVTAVKYSEKILVMDKGSVAEYDHSFPLLVENPSQYLEPSFVESKAEAPTSPTSNTLFSSMVRAMTKRQQAKIMRMAYDQYVKMNKQSKISAEDELLLIK